LVIWCYKIKVLYNILSQKHHGELQQDAKNHVTGSVRSNSQKNKKVNLLTTATTAGSSVASGPTATSQVFTLNFI
jgi:hypothetical protein